MALSKAGLVQPQSMSTTERDLLVVAGADLGRLIYNETTGHMQQWTGSAWVNLLTTDVIISSTQLPDPLLGGTY